METNLAGASPVERRVGRLDPKRDALCTRVMQEIDGYIVRYDVRGQQHLASAASDVCDGWVTRYELQPLLDSRRLRLVGRSREERAICGAPWSDWTVELTVREIQRRHAARMTPNAAGNRLAEGKSELTGLLGGPSRSEKE